MMDAVFPLKPKNGFTVRNPYLLYCPCCGHYTGLHVGKDFLKDTRVILIPNGVDWEMDIQAEYPLNDPVQVWPNTKVMWIPEAPEFPEGIPSTVTCMVCPECYKMFYYVKYGNGKYTSDSDLFRMLKWKEIYENETAPF